MGTGVIAGRRERWSRWRVEAGQPARDASGRGPREAAAARPPRRRVVECPNRTPAIGTAMARVDEFRTAKSRRGSPNVCPRPGCGEVIKDYYYFPIGSDF